MGAVPRQVNDFRSCLKETGPLLLEVVRQLREAERGTREARAQLDQLREECAAAESFLAELRRQSSEEESRLEVVLEETRAAEARLGALRRESADAEGILHALRNEFTEARQWLDERRRQPPPAARSPALMSEGHNRLGATVDPGVVVAEVLPGTPADNAGLAMGDVILAVNGTDVISGDEMRDLIQEIPDGEAITLRVERAGIFEEIMIRLEEPPAGEAPAPEGHDRLGVTVEPGVVIAEVSPGTPAADAALLPGDVILSVDGTAVSSGPQLRELIQKAQAGAAVALQIERGQDLFEVHVPLEPVSAPQGAST
jgi:S1-C subfamily serine protease